MLHNFLVIIDPLNSGMNLRENTTFMEVFIFNGYNQQTLFQKDENLLSKKTRKMLIILLFMTII